MDEFIFTNPDCFTISNKSKPNSTNVILNNSNPNSTSPMQKSNALDKSNSTSGNIKYSLNSASNFFTELDDLLLFEHANNNNDETLGSPTSSSSIHYQQNSMNTTPKETRIPEVSHLQTILVIPKKSMYKRKLRKFSMQTMNKISKEKH